VERHCAAELQAAFDALDAGDAERALGRACYGLGLSLLFAGDREGAIAQYVRLKDLDPALAQDLYRRIFP